MTRVFPQHTGPAPLLLRHRSADQSAQPTQVDPVPRLAGLRFGSLGRFEEHRDGLKPFIVEQAGERGYPDLPPSDVRVPIHTRAERALTVVEMDGYLSYLGGENRTDQMLAFLEKLAEEHPGRIPARRRLSDLYLHLGRKEDAINQLDALGDLLVDSGDRAAAIQTIKQIISLDPPNKVDYQFLLQQIRSQE